MNFSVFSTYLSILRRPLVGRPALGVVVGSVPIGIVGLTTLLLARQTSGHYSGATLVAGALVLGTCGGIAVQGRVIDRFGIPRVLLPAAAWQIMSAMTLVAVLTHGAPTPVAALLAALVGVGEPQVGGSLRALWSDLVPDDERAAARALSGLLLEIPVLFGPLLLVGLLATVGSAVALLVEAVLGALGAVLVATSRAARNWQGSPASGTSTPGRRTVRRRWDRAAVTVAAVHGVAGAIVQVASVAHATAAHAGPLLPAVIAATGVGSLVGTTVAGRRRVRPDRVPRTVRRMLVAAAAAIILTAAVAPTTDLLAFAGALLVVGCMSGPVALFTFALADAAEDRPGVAVFADVIAASLAGSAIGTAVAGPILDRVDGPWAFVVAAVSELAAAGPTLTRLRRPRTGRP